MAFWIAEADVEFERFGTGLGEHETGVEQTAEGFAIAFHGMDRLDDDFFFDHFEHFIIDDWSGAVGPHAAGVGTLIAVVGGFVILARRESENGFSVGDGEYAGFGAMEPFFDDHLRAGAAEFATPSDAIDCAEGIFTACADDDPFAGGESIGFDHDGGFVFFVGVASLDEPHGAIGVAEGLVVGGRYVCLAEDALAEDFAAFELCRGFGGAEDTKAFGLKGIDDSEGQGGFGANDGQIDFGGFDELQKGGDIGGRDGDIGCIQGGASISWGNKDVLDSRTLPNFPGHCVFATTVSNHQNFHAYSRFPTRFLSGNTNRHSIR